VAGDDLMDELVRALRVAPAGPERFVAHCPDWWGPRLFGGMVMAQALSAAIQSVDGPLLPHSLHGYFLRPVVPGVEAELLVEPVRDSRSFATRQVTTIQGGLPAARMTCSFHVEEEGAESYQLPMDSAMDSPDSLPLGSPPGPFESVHLDPVPGADGTYSSSGRFWNRVSSALPDDPDLHVGALALMSDMTRASFRPATMDKWGSHTDASIDHAVWFHRPARADQWLFYDLAAVVNTGNRATVRGTMYSAEGVLVLSMAQELLIRPVPGGGAIAPWLADKF